jgi:hypothetical protein
MSTANDANMIGARKDVVKESQGPFSNPAMVANYADETPRKVPGLAISIAWRCCFSASGHSKRPIFL